MNIERQLEIAWAAGLFEGEGTIYGRNNGAGVRLRLSMTDKEVVEKFARVFDLNVVKRSNAFGNCQEQWEAAVEAKAKVNEIVCAMQPYLCARRKAQIERTMGAFLPLDWEAA